MNSFLSKTKKPPRLNPNLGLPILHHWGRMKEKAESPGEGQGSVIQEIMGAESPGTVDAESPRTVGAESPLGQPLPNNKILASSLLSLGLLLL